MTMFELVILASLIAMFGWGVIIGSRINRSLIRNRMVRANREGYNRGLEEFSRERDKFHADRSRYVDVILRLQSQVASQAQALYKAHHDS